MVAPMNSEGEKMPPEEPEAETDRRGASLATNSKSSSAGSPRSPVRMAWIVE